MMSWSPQQDRAIKAIKDWLSYPEPQLFRLFGYAGTGKSTLAAEIGRSRGGVVFASLTGKAAHVLRQKGCTSCSTIHKLIYKTTWDEERERFVHDLKKPAELWPVHLIVIDEASMVNARLAHDLMSFGKPILVIGDPAQLPPVEGEHFFMGVKPDAMLTEIHRQARNNPILRLADDVRRGRKLPRYLDEDNLRITDDADPLDYDIVLCGTNDTRRRLNRRIRRLRRFQRASESSRGPQLGETLVCLRNDYAVNAPVFNGSTWTVRSVCQSDDIWRLGLSSAPDRTAVQVPDACFTSEPPKLLNGYQSFDFGYALTVHKAQGSEWARVLLINESGVFRDQARRWLYTGVTRASDRLTIESWE